MRQADLFTAAQLTAAIPGVTASLIRTWTYRGHLHPVARCGGSPLYDPHTVVALLATRGQRDWTQRAA